MKKSDKILGVNDCIHADNASGSWIYTPDGHSAPCTYEHGCKIYTKIHINILNPKCYMQSLYEPDIEGPVDYSAGTGAKTIKMHASAGNCYFALKFWIDDND